jgi:hypothetical protein
MCGFAGAKLRDVKRETRKEEREDGEKVPNTRERCLSFRSPE